MNAADARKKRGGSALVERTRQEPRRAARIDRLVTQASIELMLRQIMARENITAAELARRVDAKPPQISRDLRGGLSKATLSRITELVRALGYDFVPMLIPHNDARKHKALSQIYRETISVPTRPVKKQKAAQH